jgi:hypothetical protein
MSLTDTTEARNHSSNFPFDVRIIGPLFSELSSEIDLCRATAHASGTRDFVCVLQKVTQVLRVIKQELDSAWWVKERK